MSGNLLNSYPMVAGHHCLKLKYILIMFYFIKLITGLHIMPNEPAMDFYIVKYN